MSNGFAGAKSLDDRRRRRLASEADRQKHATAAISNGTRQRTPSRDDAMPAVLRLSRLISRRVWKHSLIALPLLLIVGGLILAAHHEVTQRLLSAHPAGQAVLAIAPRAGLFLSVTLLMLAGQLSLLTGWVRSANAKDFGGRYSIWRWVAAGWFLWAFCVATGAHWAVSRLFERMSGVTYWHSETANWLAPAVLVGAFLTWQLLRDMSRSVASCVLFAVSVVCGLAAGIVQLIDSPVLPQIVSAALLPAACVFGFLGMLAHARFVIHVSSAPPQSAKSAANRDADDEESEENSKSLGRGEADADTSNLFGVYDGDDRGQSRSGRSTKTRGKQRNKRSHDPDDYEELENEPPRKRRRTKKVEPIVTADELKGLSKRERRQLRKQRRDEQRAMRKAG